MMPIILLNSPAGTLHAGRYLSHTFLCDVLVHCYLVVVAGGLSSLPRMCFLSLAFGARKRSRAHLARPAVCRPLATALAKTSHLRARRRAPAFVSTPRRYDARGMGFRNRHGPMQRQKANGNESRPTTQASACRWCEADDVCRSVHECRVYINTNSSFRREYNPIPALLW